MEKQDQKLSFSSQESNQIQKSTQIEIQQKNQIKKLSQDTLKIQIPQELFLNLCTIFGQLSLDFDIMNSLNQSQIDQIIQTSKKIKDIYVFKHHFNKFLNLNNNFDKNIQFITKNCVNVIQRLIYHGFPKRMIYSYLAIIKEYSQQILQNKEFLPLESIYLYQSKIPMIFLIDYIITFKLKLSQDKIIQYLPQFLLFNPQGIQNLLEGSSRQLKIKCFEICLLKLQKQLKAQKNNNKQIKRKRRIIYQMIRKNKLKQTDFPQIHKQNLKTAAFHHLRQGWQIFQQVCMINKQLLSYGVNSLLKNKKTFNQGLSICKNNPWVINKLYKDNQKKVNQILNRPYQNIIINPLLTNHFSPSNKQSIHLQKFGIKRKDVIFVNYNKQVQQIKQIMQHINKQGVIAIDTQSIVLRTALTYDVDNLSIIQVAVNGKVYIFDAFDISKSQITKKGFQKFFSNTNNKLIGHALQNDIGVFRQVLKITQPQKCQIIQIRRFYPHMDKQIKGNPPSLAKICKQQFNQQLCKKYTMTNWQRRPLLENQIHYAALDAYIVLQIYNRNKDKK